MKIAHYSSLSSHDYYYLLDSILNNTDDLTESKRKAS